MPYLEKTVNCKTLDEMSAELQVDKEELRQFLHHHRRFRVIKKDNLVIRLLSQLIVYPEYFHPNDKFYNATGIRQRRWWQLFKGEKKITEKEYRALCNHLKVESKTAMNVRQLDMFENAL